MTKPSFTKDIDAILEAAKIALRSAFLSSCADDIGGMTELALRSMEAGRQRRAAATHSNWNPVGALSVRLLDELVREVATEDPSGPRRTRTKRMLSLMLETPVVDEEGAVLALDTVSGRLVPRGNATPADVVSAWGAMHSQAVDERWWKDLDVAKVTKAASLRLPRLKLMRATTPDYGALLLTEALCLLEAGPDTLGRASFPTIQWAIDVLEDALSVFQVDHPRLRAEVFIGYFDPEQSLSRQEMDAMGLALDSVHVSDGASPAERAEAKARYDADREYYDAARATWADLQRAIDGVQADAVSAISELLTYARYALSEKEWFQGAKKAAAPKALSAAKTGKRSACTPDDAVKALAGMEVEVDITMSFNPLALGLSEVARKRTLASVLLDGPRETSVYPGVVWEAVIGPMDHALDLDRSSRELRMVVIAPRRTGNMGLDMREARVLAVDDYESYFTPVAED